MEAFEPKWVNPIISNIELTYLGSEASKYLFITVSYSYSKEKHVTNEQRSEPNSSIRVHIA